MTLDDAVRVTPPPRPRPSASRSPIGTSFDSPTPVRGTVSSTSVLPAVDSSRFVVRQPVSCAQ